MSTSSGLRGSCDVCLHLNNEHSAAPCPVSRCWNRWKRGQVTGGCFKKSNSFTWWMCYACKDHPGAKDNLILGGLRQRDVTRAQRNDYKLTRVTGGDTSSGKVDSSSPVASS
ncbi:hypothetical protein BO82DRAFT_247684, partial [Aspergillus uvarum CBS 121591]